MKLAFSTLGVPGMPVDQVARLAAVHGFHGVELRAHPGEEPVHTGLDGAARAEAAALFRAAGVAVLSIGSYVKVAAPGDDDAVVADLRAHLALAADDSVRRGAFDTRFLEHWLETEFAARAGASAEVA